MRNLLFVVLYLLSFSSFALSEFGTSGEPRRIAKLQMQDLDGSLLLMIYAPDGEPFEFDIASSADNQQVCDRDGDQLTRSAVLRIDGNRHADYYFAMLLSATSSGSAVELSYNDCMETFGTSWPVVYAVVLHSLFDSA